MISGFACRTHFEIRHLIPFVPRSFDVWTLSAVAGLVDEIRTVNPDLQALVFLNRADPRGSDNDDAEVFLPEAPGLELVPVRLGTRKAFGNAAARGLAVTELRPQDPKATQEIFALARCVAGEGG